MRSFLVWQRIIVFALLLFVVTNVALTQISDKVSKINVGQFRSHESLLIQAELINQAEIERVEITYRSFGQSEYKRGEMTLTGNTAAYTVPVQDLAPPFLEYYLILYLQATKEQETYPKENAAQYPLKIDLLEQPENAASSSTSDDVITILSPEEGEHVSANDFLISFSLLRADSSIDRTATKVYLDGKDVSNGAVISGDLIVVNPANISENVDNGSHAVKIDLYDKQGKAVYSKSLGFSVGGVSQPIAVSGQRSAWVYTSSIQAEARSENIDISTTPYNRLSLSAGGTYNQFRINGHLYVTNEEKDTRQPQHRYYIGGESPWLKIGFGDSYPAFPEFIMSGRRVRGFTGTLTLGAFNLDITKGDIIRRIDTSPVELIPLDSLPSRQQNYPDSAYISVDSSRQTWGVFTQHGTFTRDLFAIRPSFGPRDGAHIGFTYLKSLDDIHSISYGIRPQENLVVGTDLIVPFDDHNVEITAKAAFSATNKDITSGTFSDEKIDSIYKDQSESTRDNIKRMKDIISKFITVNENLIPLNMTNTPTLFYEGGLSMNYFNNYFKFTYLRHGNNYESFGQSFIRPDVVGFNITDRLRLVRNELLLSGGFERLQDNTANTKSATTTSATTNVSASWFPRSDVPNITLGYLFSSNSNGLINDSLKIDDNLNRILVQIGKEFVLGVRHNASLSVSTSVRDDKTYKDFDSRNTLVALNNMTTFSIPLQLLASMTVSSNTFPSFSGSGSKDTTLNYTTFYVSAQYRLMEDKLRLSGALSPTFGDIQRTLIDARAQYYFVHNVSALVQLSLFLNKNAANDSIWSLILRADI